MSFNDDLIADVRKNGKATSGPFVGRPLLVLTTKGAKSGAERSVPVVYSKDGDAYVVVASKGGSPTHPDWYFNIRATPTVTVEVDKERFEAKAEIASPDSERVSLYQKHAALHPGFNDYLKKTSRKIPVIRLKRIASAAS